MNTFVIFFLLASGVGIFTLPRQWAPIPLLVGTLYITLGQVIELGPFSFTVIRILIAAGTVRAIIRGERLAGRINGLDGLIIAWSIWAAISSFFHNVPSEALIYRLGFVYNAVGIYFLLRVFCQSFDDVMRLCCITGILLVPLAIEMLSETTTGYNLFSIFGSIAETPTIREGRFRAQGPFGHAILAGTVGAVCLPIMIGLWQKRRKFAIVGIAACIAIIFTSASSGPILSGLAAILALFMWPWHYRMRLVRWTAVIGYIALDVVMKAPAYYLISRIGPIGARTGWHRARLIESAFAHLNEWWFAGTDYTRHWMPTGVPWSLEHTDITNYYLKMGVIGGGALLILFILILAKGFSYVGQLIPKRKNLSSDSYFFLWSLGASLFAHATTCISVSYFDQSFLFIYLNLAAISSIWSEKISNQA